MTVPATRPIVKRRQIVTYEVTTNGDAEPADVVRTILRNDDRVFDIRYSGDIQPVTDLYGANRERLTQLAVWVAGEDAKQRLGLPSEWDQTDWLRRKDPNDTGNSCGTACCIAGKLALDDGGKPVVEKFDARTEEYIETTWADVEAGWTSGSVCFPGSNAKVQVRDYARDVLGLDDSQADRLFNGSNNLDNILAVIREFLGDSPQTDVDEYELVVGAPAGGVRTQRRRRPDGNPDNYCGMQSCNICYEDVEVPF